jgi:hypothetical protein
MDSLEDAVGDHVALLMEFSVLPLKDIKGLRLIGVGDGNAELEVLRGLVHHLDLDLRRHARAALVSLCASSSSTFNIIDIKIFILYINLERKARYSAEERGEEEGKKGETNQTISRFDGV